jgi:hypothetical protein
MANDYSAWTNVIFGKALVALKENAIMSRLVNTDFGAEVAQHGDTINVKVASSKTVRDVTPGPVPPAGDDQAPTVVPITLDQWKMTDMHLTDKEVKSIVEGPGRNNEIDEAMKAIVNYVDTYILGLYKGIYGFAGTAGTTPFVSDLSAATDADRVLGDQLCPMEPRRIVMNTRAKANALLLRSVQDASFRKSGEDTLASGQIGELLGMHWFVDQNTQRHVAGTGTGYLVNNVAGYAVGIKTIACDTGSGTLLAGDIITFAGHTQTYTVVSTVGGGTVTSITFEPGLKVALTDNLAITRQASHTVTLAFHRDAFALAVRPLVPADGFTGGNIIRTAVEPVSGLSLTLEVSREHYRTKWAFSILFGAKLVRAALASRIAGE